LNLNTLTQISTEEEEEEEEEEETQNGER